ncbi:MAG TPA: protease inhibitor I42 family protein [Methanofastidiosum sp.]|nr:protease inhibitor I42 family protein [Methanofastidiosum sp.]HPA49021.1 protease inhibitor I42 family protein [Methanofastidiosum sp.]HQK62379.1 protease inhibitor I42 family protein [Methanofastidiosum sp.]HQM94816.1 protease inhibitor I42 family protein [Methanofastidiosum sp.]HQQ48338.1 protease inhibitor I42 family protein [Methanofastidiosum sp.]
MDKNIKILIGALAILILLIAAYFAFFSNNIKTYDETHTGTIVVAKGNSFKISLNSNPTTGFQWTPEYDSNLIELVNTEYKADEPQLMGSGGKDIYEFKVIGSNTDTSIKFTYARPWESVPPINAKSFQINIK